MVSTTQAAVEQLMTKRIDWLVIDVRNLPDGEEPALYQAVRRFRGTHLEIPIILYRDNQVAARLTKRALPWGLTIASSPDALLSGLIAIRRDD